jgi:hypothetical protein
MAKSSKKKSAKTSSTITRTLRNAQKAITSFIKPGRRKAAATIDDIIDMLHDARLSLAKQVGSAPKKATKKKAKKAKKKAPAKKAKSHKVKSRKAKVTRRAA